MARYLIAVTALLALVAGTTAQTAAAPAPSASNCSTIAQVAAGAPGLTTLLAAVQVANLTGVLSTPGLNWTVFAPTNSAFQVLLDRMNITADAALSQPTLLEALLLNHIYADGAVKAAMLMDGEILPTLLPNSTVSVSIRSPAPAPATAAMRKMLQAPSGTNVYVQSAGTVVRDGAAQVLIADIPACGAVIHIIDAVLVPSTQNLAAYLAA